MASSTSASRMRLASAGSMPARHGRRRRARRCRRSPGSGTTPRRARPGPRRTRRCRRRSAPSSRPRRRWPAAARACASSSLSRAMSPRRGRRGPARGAAARRGRRRPRSSMSSGSASDDRTGPPRGGHREGARDDLGQARGVVDLRRPLRDRAVHRAVVELLEALAPDRLARDLPDEQQHRRRVLEGGVHAVGGVRRSRPARDQADARAAGELAVGLGHVRRAALVARDDQAQRRVVQRVEHRQVALAGDAEGQVGPVQHELVDQDLPAAARQRRTGCSRKIVARWVLGLSASDGST